MNANLRFALVASLVLFACDAGPRGLILGKWEVKNAPMKMTAEFSGDGTATLTVLGQMVQGTYKLNAGNELEWTMNGITTKAKANVSATELELTDDANRTIKYRKVKQAAW